MVKMPYILFNYKLISNNNQFYFVFVMQNILVKLYNYLLLKCDGKIGNKLNLFLTLQVAERLLLEF